MNNDVFSVGACPAKYQDKLFLQEKDLSCLKTRQKWTVRSYIPKEKAHTPFSHGELQFLCRSTYDTFVFVCKNYV